jgi:hypothetical protein
MSFLKCLVGGLRHCEEPKATRQSPRKIWDSFVFRILRLLRPAFAGLAMTIDNIPFNYAIKHSEMYVTVHEKGEEK